MKKRSFALLLTLALLLGLAACGAKSENSYPAGYDGAYMTMEAPEGYWEAAEDQSMPSAGTDTRSALPDGVKMIYRASLELESTEFDRAGGDIATLVEQLGGYFEQRSVRSYSSGYHYANYTVRIPAEHFQSFLNQIGNVCHVIYKTDSAENITEMYFDTESRFKTAQIKLERLQALLEKAESMEDIITIESAISDTEYDIEYLSGELRHYDALVGYATIDISLNEVKKLTEVETEPPTFAQRIGGAFRDGLSDFGDSLQDLAEWLAYNWLTLLVIAAVATAVVRLVRRRRAKRAWDASGAKGGKKLFAKKSKNTPTEENSEP